MKRQCPGHSRCSINAIGSGGSDNVEIMVAYSDDGDADGGDDDRKVSTTMMQVDAGDHT